MTAAPHDLEAEAAVLGAILNRPDLAGEILTLLRPADLYRPAHTSILAAIENLRRDGRAWDVSAVATEARRLGGEFEPAELVSMQTRGTFAWRRTAERLVELRARRQLAALGARLSESALDEAQHPGDSIEQARIALDSVDVVADDLDDSLMLSAAIARTDYAAEPWVIKGLLRRMWRAMVVGFEGDGKTTLLAQVGWCASQGLHPFNFRHLDPVMVLHVDLENTIDRVSDGYRPLLTACERHSRCFDDGRHFTWHRPDGIDIRGRRDRSQFEARLRRIQPDLVCIGPLRKSYQPRPGENDERASLAMQAVFDDLRARYGFALLIEHHAPHGEGGSRKARPFGSSTWLGWPEFGISMDKKNDSLGQFKLGRFRGDRVQAAWPNEIHKTGPGSDWYWDGYWANPDALRAVS